MTITDLGRDGCQIEFPYDKALVATLKERFPKARWSQNLRVWCVPGPLAYRRALTWQGEVEVVAREAQKAPEKARREAEFDGRLAEVDPAAALATRRGEFKSRRIILTGASVAYPFDYDSRCVEIAKASGAKFDPATKIWSWRAETVARIDTIVDAANYIYAIRLADQQRREREKAERADEIERERAARDQHFAKVRAHRFAVLASSAPTVGSTLRRYGEVVIIESLGKAFRADDDLSSMGGPIGAEGEWVRYAYFRAAAPDEIVALEANEAAARAEGGRRKAQRAAIDVVAASNDAPDLGAAPDGDILWSDDEHAATGYTRRIVLTAEGWLWLITYDGSDGAAWGDYNCGYNTHGARLRATPELIAAIKAVE